MRYSYSAWGDEIAWSCEVRLPHIGNKVVPEVRSVIKIKDLEDRLKVGPLTDLEVFRDTSIQLEERLTAQIVKCGNRTLA